MDAATAEFLKSKRQHKYYSKQERWKEKQEIELEETKDEFPCGDEAIKAETTVPATNYLKQGQPIPKNSLTPKKIIEASQQIKNVSINSSLQFDAYDRILCSMSAQANGDLSSMINNDKDGYDLFGNSAKNTLQLPTAIQKESYEDEDQFQAYNFKVQKTGTINEWKDKAYEWDDLVQTLNQKLFGN